MSASFTYSAGWKVIGPTLIQRRAPLMTTPIFGMSTATSMSTARMRIGYAILR